MEQHLQKPFGKHQSTVTSSPYHHKHLISLSRVAYPNQPLSLEAPPFLFHFLPVRLYGCVAMKVYGLSIVSVSEWATERRLAKIDSCDPIGEMSSRLGIDGDFSDEATTIFKLALNTTPYPVLLLSSTVTIPTDNGWSCNLRSTLGGAHSALTDFWCCSFWSW